MGAGMVLIDTQASTAATVASHKVDRAVGGGFRRAGFYVDVLSIGAGDTWTIALQWGLVSNVVTLAQLAATATGLQEIVVESPFKDANRAIPAPSHVVYTLTVDGGTAEFTGKVYAIFGD